MTLRRPLRVLSTRTQSTQYFRHGRSAGKSPSDMRPPSFLSDLSGVPAIHHLKRLTRWVADTRAKSAPVGHDDGVCFETHEKELWRAILSVRSLALDIV